MYLILVVSENRLAARVSGVAVRGVPGGVHRIGMPAGIFPAPRIKPRGILLF